MEDTFHHMWLLIGDPDNIYKEKYETIPLEEAEDLVEAEPLGFAAGYHCRYANRLRNGNCQIDLNLPREPVIKVNKISDLKTGAIYNCAGSLLAQHHGMWAMYYASSLSKSAEGNWGNNECTFFCFDSGFHIFDDVLLKFSAEGRLLNKIHITSGSDIKHHEIAWINGYTISSGFLTEDSFPDALPGNLMPSGQLESFREEDLTPLEEPGEIQETSQSNMLAFLEDNPLIPIYLDSMIVLSLENKIALLSYELKILKVLEREFLQLAVSASKTSLIYVSALIDDKLSLFVCDTGGHVGFTVNIPMAFGACVSPPAIARNGNIYWFGEKGFAVFNEKGESLWSAFYPGKTGSGIFPILYNDVLTLCHDTACTAYGSDGERLFHTEDIEGRINTPLVPGPLGEYFLGTENGIYKIEFR